MNYSIVLLDKNRSEIGKVTKAKALPRSKEILMWEGVNYKVANVFHILDLDKITVFVDKLNGL